MAQPLFIVVEGADGSGKTTQAQLLAEHFKSLGKKVLLSREPSLGEIGQFIRKFISDPECDLDERTLALLFTADRSDHLNRIFKEDSDVDIIIFDRYYYSSVVYQYGMVDKEYLWSLQKNFQTPDITFFFKIPPHIVVQRIEDRGQERDIFETTEKVYHFSERYLSVMQDSEQYGHNIVTLSIDDMNIEQVQQEVLLQFEYFCNWNSIVI